LKHNWSGNRHASMKYENSGSNCRCNYKPGTGFTQEAPPIVKHSRHCEQRCRDQNRILIDIAKDIGRYQPREYPTHNTTKRGGKIEVGKPYTRRAAAIKSPVANQRE